MSKNEEILSFVDSDLRLEGMILSVAEKRVIADCLSGRTTFDEEIKKIIAQCKRAVV